MCHAAILQSGHFLLSVSPVAPVGPVGPGAPDAPVAPVSPFLSPPPILQEQADNIDTDKTRITNLTIIDFSSVFTPFSISLEFNLCRKPSY